MDEKQIKNYIDEYIGEEKLLNDGLKKRIMNQVIKKQNKIGVFTMLKKLTPAFVLFLTIIGGITFYLLYNSENQVEVSSSNIDDLESNNVQGTDEIANTNTEAQLQLHDEFREVLNLTFSTINAMVEKDYTYLSEISDPSIEINNMNHTITFNGIGENGYEANLLKEFDFKTLEYRGYHSEEDEMFIFLAINHIAYEFTFVKGKTKHGNYLLKSIITN